MDDISRSPRREIIKNFADEIKRAATHGTTPSKQVIHFRGEDKRHSERDVVLVPLELLRFRKDNGRITSDVLSYEKNKGYLQEEKAETQMVLREFLEKKDPEKTQELVNNIRHYGQKEAAIITADGFLINGNRRKMALMKLCEATNSDEYKYMKVVILPGDDDEGGPPTLLEIEEIENKYQLQNEGKSEYYNFDKALSIRRKVQIGMTLEEQLRHDPNFANLSQKDFNKKVKEWEEEYLKPLDCVDRYLEFFNRPGMYDSVSTGSTDREGRWQAFLDYYKNVRKKLEDDAGRIRMSIEEDEVGDIEDIAFKIIRKRELQQLPGSPKVHRIMRELPRYIGNPDSKEKLIKILDVDPNLPHDEEYDSEGNEIDEREKDRRWSSKNESRIIGPLKEAIELYGRTEAQETPISLLEGALKKLDNEKMIPSAVSAYDNDEAVRLAESIEKKAAELKKEFWKHKKLNKVPIGTKGYL